MKTPVVVSALIAFALLMAVGLGNSLFPLTISLGLAYLSFPLIQILEKKKIRRELSVTAVFALISLALLITLVLAVPRLIDEARLLSGELPEITNRSLNRLLLFMQQWGLEQHFNPETIRVYVTDHLGDWPEKILSSAGGFLKTSFTGIADGILGLLNLLMIPLFYFYLIIYIESINTSAKSFIPISWRPTLQRYSSLANSILSGYIRGQLVVITILSFIYSIGFSVAGLKFAFLIGVATGILSIIPFVGSLMGLALALTMSLIYFTSWTTLIGVVIIFAIVQLLEGFVITPKFVGDKVGLNALSTMLALIVGGNLLGLVGMILAIPTAAMLKHVLADLKQEYVKLDFYKN